MNVEEPMWLSAWREGKRAAPQPAPTRQPKPKRPPPAKPTVKANYLGFIEPQRWPQDDGTRREPVLDTDHKPPRVVRYVGWRRCMCCGVLFWSQDVQRLRLCTGDGVSRLGCRSRDDTDGI
ncbi:hypothetical protein ACPTGE_06690 [Pseudomonas aeruginosa]|uniref:hypothetical protein n=1 Tax=Pseudomonas aeruginosa TaxID=287 RepID=UPI003CC59984